MLRSLFLVLGSIAAVAACGSDDDSASSSATVVGVNDVSKACAIRAGWKNPTASECITCKAQAAVPRCSCSTVKEYGGKCSDHVEKRNAEPTCQGVAECVQKCTDDCTCIDGCYAGKDVCRTIGSSLDGCLTEVCGKYCQ